MDKKDLTIPQLDVNDDKVTIENLRFSNLDYVEVNDVIYTVSTSKSVEDYEVDFSGYIVYFVEDGHDVKIGESAGMIFKDLEEAKLKLNEIITAKKEEIGPAASKKAIKYAQEIDFDISLINKAGVIKVQDIVAFLNKE